MYIHGAEVYGHGTTVVEYGIDIDEGMGPDIRIVTYIGVPPDVASRLSMSIPCWT